MKSHPKVVSVVGTRPNFMKIAPVQRALARRDGVDLVLVHTGQHYDEQMSAIFLNELGLDTPDYVLGVGSGTHAEQVSRVLDRLDAVLREVRPDLVLVPGDVNSTLGAALAAFSAGVPVGHVEAGLRSFDRTMPEETNRVLVDAVADLLFTHSPEARENLLREGRPAASVHEVGNTMIDTLVAMRDRIAAVNAASAFGVRPRAYGVVTLHRPALVDDPDALASTVAALRDISATLPLLFPVHPRTRRSLEALGGIGAPQDILLVEPLGYLEFLSLVADAACVITDSGGIQEETTYLGIPCFTLRTTTERPVTVALGTNVLLGLDANRVREIPLLLERARRRDHIVPAGWDGYAAERIADVVAATLGVGPAVAAASR